MVQDDALILFEIVLFSCKLSMHTTLTGSREENIQIQTHRLYYAILDTAISFLIFPTLHFETLASYKLLLQAPGAKVNVGYKTWIQIFLSTQDHHGVM